MAVPNMIVTLAMNATKYGAGLKKAAAETSTFGKFTTKAFNVAKGAMVGLTLAALRYIPTLANMGAESRKADIQLRFMLETMQGVSKATDASVKRMAKYADQVSRATGIDDEQVKAVQKKLLMFRTLRKTVDELGGTFDRTTMAAIDLAAGGFGDMESNAIKLGRMLENPTKALNAMNRAGVTFTETERRKIIALQESGKLLEAQDLILGKVEGRVEGLAEKSATPFERMVQQFNQIGDAIGELMLPALESMNEEISAWLGTPQGKADMKMLAGGFVAASKAIKVTVVFLREVARIIKSLGFNPLGVSEDRMKASADYWKTVGGAQNPVDYTPGSGTTTRGSSRMAEKSGITVNINAPIDSVSAGREIQRVLDDYKRANGSR